MSKSVRLTAGDRAAFVAGVMGAILRVDHQEQARALALEYFVARLPEAVRRVWQDPTLRGYVRTQYFSSGLSGLGSVSVPWSHDATTDCDDALDDVTRGKLHNLSFAADKQQEERDRIKGQLERAAASVTTRQALRDLLPELAHHVPADSTGAYPVGFPLGAAANLIAALTEAGYKIKQEHTAS